ncbi:MAG: TIGR04282 family arsenosugar biosynthesis glycosyltransferase [Allosphingosinicella sp.]|uniref:TIGR04282 family arsenosugar biosynthesis glycosyltransferase n=1 Tax=Allosphingosinicella sp. TaxID=2823234 RepID=UPI00393292FE
MKARVIVFAKAPVAGRVKTRLIPALGAGGAAALAKDMLACTVAEALASGLDVELAGDPDPAGWYDGPPLRLAAQGEGDLGARLARAAARCLAGGARPLLIGTDCPALDRHRLRAAAEALDEADAILHPAADGGYVLLGLARFDPSLFAGIAWSTAGVAAATVARIDRLGWRLHLGETLRDVDDPEDLFLLPDAGKMR